MRAASSSSIVSGSALRAATSRLEEAPMLTTVDGAVCVTDGKGHFAHGKVSWGARLPSIIARRQDNDEG